MNVLTDLSNDAALIVPNYLKDTIANLPATISDILDVPFAGLPRIELGESTTALDADRVILLIIDGLGQNLYEKADSKVFDLGVETAVHTTLTSIFPSTTVAALSSMWTGVAPAQHGLLGLKMFFPEFATAGQMIRFTPIFKNVPDALVDAGLELETFLQYEGFCEQLTRFDIETHVFKGKSIVDSALSQMHGRGVTETYGVTTFAEMLVRMRGLIEGKLDAKLFVSGYWSTVDTLSHSFGWTHDAVMAELVALFWQIKHVFVEQLSHEARQNTLLLLVADHGQTICPPEQHVFLSDHPKLERMLFMRPTGEPRVAFLYTKHRKEAAVIDYIKQNLGHAFLPIAGSEALKMGLFGPQPFVEEAEQRVGDVVVIAKEGYGLFAEQERSKADKLLGRHGSLTFDEMRVPLLGYRLG